MTTLAEWKAEQGRVWGSASWQEIAARTRVGYARPKGAGRPADWVRRDYVSELLGQDFELEFVDAVCPWIGESGEALWQLYITSDGPAKVGIASLPAEERDLLHTDWVEYFERHRTGDGISAPRPYRIVLGRRRG